MISSIHDNPWSDETSTGGGSITGSSLLPRKTNDENPNEEEANKREDLPKRNTFPRRTSNKDGPIHTEDSTSDRGLIPADTEIVERSLDLEYMANEDQAFAEIFFGCQTGHSKQERRNKRNETKEEWRARKLREKSNREREAFLGRLD